MDLHLEQCPICGGDLQKAKIVAEVVRGGHTAMLKVKADVCLDCGERLCLMDTGKQFNKIKAFKCHRG